MQKVSVYHFLNSDKGGVFAVIKNLLFFSKNTEIENHVVFTFNSDTTSKSDIQQIEGAVSQQVFYYSANSNFYYTCKQLAKLLPDDQAVIVAHDWLELGMASALGLQNPVVHFLHGNYEYYYDLAARHEKSTDVFVTVSPPIYHRLCLTLPHRQNHIHYCRFPVIDIKSGSNNNPIIRIIYCVRTLTDDNKQFKLLPEINAILQSKKVVVQWTIIGSGITAEQVKKVMGEKDNVTLFEYLPNEEVAKLLPAHDLFILPSLLEGFPVALVEAMKAGLVPLVSNWSGATDELVLPGTTGYYFDFGDADGYAATISLLNKDRMLLRSLADNAIKKARDLFDPFVNTTKIEVLLLISARNQTKKEKKSFKVYGSRLDHLMMPNKIVKVIRKLRSLKF